MPNTVTFGRCEGCEQTALLTAGQIVPRIKRGTIKSVEYCAECWDIVDNADPETGAFGAGCCDVKRWIDTAFVDIIAIERKVINEILSAANPPLLEYEDSRDNARQP